MSAFSKLKTVLLTLVLSMGLMAVAPASAQSISLNGFVSSALEIVKFDPVHEARGFGGAKRGGFGMNFGGNKGASNATRNNTAANNNAAANQRNAGTAAGTAGRAGLMGFLGGMGLMGLAMLGAGVFGGGFLLYLLAMFLLPSLIAAITGRRQEQAADMPASKYSEQELFGRQNQEQHYQDQDDAEFKKENMKYRKF